MPTASVRKWMRRAVRVCRSESKVQICAFRRALNALARAFGGFGAHLDVRITRVSLTEMRTIRRSICRATHSADPGYPGSANSRLGRSQLGRFCLMPHRDVRIEVVLQE